MSFNILIAMKDFIELNFLELIENNIEIEDENG